ncbi:hypothetical protein ASG45_02465 [Microbacterium sp. Leaf436]|nr:hypothetical protein ASG45_02465 [Microbacterium sp. Leaf436]
MLAWERRKDDLTLPLTETEWAQLRVDLRNACANHKKTDPLYAYAGSCGHDVPEDPDAEDGVHRWSDEADALLCMAAVVGYACICQDGYCSQEASAIEARDDLWYAVSMQKRRADRSAHLAGMVTKVWLDSTLSLEQVQDIAADCRDEAQLVRRAAEVAKAGGGDAS